MRGRKPVPTHLKLIKGDPRKEGRGKLEAKAAGEAKRAPPALPSPPPGLSADALAEWNRLVVHLHPAGLLAEVDAGALASICTAFGRWRQIERLIAKVREKDPVFEGVLIKSQKGNMIVNPLLAAARIAMNDFCRLASEFGMTPAARARIANLEPPADDDPADEFFR